MRLVDLADGCAQWRGGLASEWLLKGDDAIDPSHHSPDR